MDHYNFKFYIGSQEITVPSKIQLLNSISQEIAQSLIFNSNHEYHVQSPVDEEIFREFIDCLINKKIPDIKFDNINEYILLSQEFESLQETVQKKKEEFGEFFINLKGIQDINNPNWPCFVKDIAIKLDEYIKNHGKQLMESPIHSLYNIFNHELRNLTQFDLAYNLIKEQWVITGDKKIFILLESLDGSKLCQSNFNDAISHKNERFGYCPKIDLSFLSSKFDQIEKHDLQLQTLIEQNEQYLNLINQKEEEKKNLKIAYEKDIELLNFRLDKIEENREAIASLKKRVKKLENRCAQFIQEQLLNMLYKPVAYQEKKEFEGIINYLKTNGNIDDEIKITSSPPYINDGRDSPKNVIQYDSSSCFRSDDVADAFICFEFINKRVILRNYTLRSSNEYGISPRSWVIEGKNDGMEWEIIDEQCNCDFLNHFNRAHTFKVNNEENGIFKYIRIRQIDTNWFQNGIPNNILLICSLEFYGYLV